MTKLFLYDDGPRGDLMFRRPLIREIVRSGQFDVTVAVCDEDRDLVDDLEGERLTIVTSDYPNTWQGASLGLGYLCPSDCVPVELSNTRYLDTLKLHWKESVEVFNRQMAEHEIDFELRYDELSIPMFDFMCEVDDGLDVEVEDTIDLRVAAGDHEEQPKRPSIYLDNARGHSSQSHFVFDLLRLASVFPGFDFMCTYPQDVRSDNLIDCSHLDVRARSRLSEDCEVLLGSTAYPFVLTLTEANRFKPKAVCGYEAFTYPSFWDYPQNPLEYLGTMDEAVDFLLANLWEKV